MTNGKPHYEVIVEKPNGPFKRDTGLNVAEGALDGHGTVALNGRASVSPAKPETYEDHWASQIAQPLTPREHNVLTLISQGCSNREVASTLYLSQQTVKNYVYSIMRKLGANNRVHAVILALKYNWLQSNITADNIMPGRSHQRL